MSSVEPRVRVRMQYLRTWYPSFEGRAYALPAWTAGSTATAKHQPAQSAQPITERPERPPVFGNRVISVIAADDTLQPCAYLIDWLVHPLAQLRLDGVKRRPHPLGYSLAAYSEMAFGVRRTMMREPKKREHLRFPSPRSCRFPCANRPNSISRVFSGWSSNAKLASRL
jgi:hypothetical protein